MILSVFCYDIQEDIQEDILEDSGEEFWEGIYSIESVPWAMLPYPVIQDAGLFLGWIRVWNITPRADNATHQQTFAAELRGGDGVRACQREGGVLLGARARALKHNYLRVFCLLLLLLISELQRGWLSVCPSSSLRKMPRPTWT